MLRLLLLSGAALLLPTMTVAQQAPQPASTATDQRADDIVVTARSLNDTARDLAACLARGCPPDQDMAATLAHAENQFVAGGYTDARRTLNDSLGRNRRAGGEFPVELSGVLRAYARVSAHLGEGRAYQLATLDIRQTLSRAFPETDGRVLAARVEVADSRARLGYVEEARRMYDDIAGDANRAGNKRVAAFSLLRLAMANYPNDVAQRRPERVRRSVSDLEAISTDATHVGADLALMADVLLARIDRDRGDMRRTDALAQRFAASGARRPLLLTGEPVRLPDEDRLLAEPGGNVLRQMQTSRVERRWVDVGFWVNRNGSVSDYEVLRHEGDTGWASAVERSVKSRRYAAMRPGDDANAPGFYLIERYTLTADWRTDCTGSHLRCRDQQMRVERLDLTPDTVAAPTPQAG